MHTWLPCTTEQLTPTPYTAASHRPSCRLNSMKLKPMHHKHFHLSPDYRSKDLPCQTVLDWEYEWSLRHESYKYAHRNPFNFFCFDIHNMLASVHTSISYVFKTIKQTTNYWNRPYIWLFSECCLCCSKSLVVGLALFLRSSFMLCMYWNDFCFISIHTIKLIHNQLFTSNSSTRHRHCHVLALASFEKKMSIHLQ